MSELISDAIVLNQSKGNVEIPVNLDEKGKLVRKGDKVELGKRFLCGLVVDIPDSEGKTARQNITGTYTSKGGRELNIGCGQEILVTKASDGALTCCDMDMVRVDPKPLPSSD